MPITTTSEQDRYFLNALFDGIEAEDILDAFKNTMKGNDASWVLEWVVENFEPEDVFDGDTLDNWAIANGFEKAE